MTTTDANGIVFLQDTDNMSPFHTLINGLQSATSTAVRKAHCKVMRNATLTATPNTPTAVVWDTADSHNTAGMWSSGSGVVVPWDGWWNLTANIGFQNASDGYRVVWIVSGGTRLAEELVNPTTGVPTQVSLATHVWLASGTSVGVNVYHSSASTLTLITGEVNPMFTVVSA